ncbi:hypothetical protein D9V28_12485 [Mycetocola zhadangensis]|uniref:Uncharacterized protein n=1 Tax=Mycetocola zhadangensis TaxID=1164595 RepID=A0A3L7IXB3_9MICO|nr:hypothetical protein D9V28_12485 [Mycetocola zhadangensis]
MLTLWVVQDRFYRFVSILVSAWRDRHLPQRPMTDLVAIVGEPHRRGIQLRSLTEPFDTTTAGGELFFHLCRVRTNEQPHDLRAHHGLP